MDWHWVDNIFTSIIYNIYQGVWKTVPIPSLISKNEKKNDEYLIAFFLTLSLPRTDYACLLR